MARTWWAASTRPTSVIAVAPQVQAAAAELTTAAPEAASDEADDDAIEASRPMAASRMATPLARAMAQAAKLVVEMAERRVAERAAIRVASRDDEDDSDPDVIRSRLMDNKVQTEEPSQVAIKAHQAVAHHRRNGVNAVHADHVRHATNQAATAKAATE